MTARHERTAAVLQDVAAERAAQVEKWGTQRHSWPEWMSILTEEVGEAAQAANKAHWTVPDYRESIRKQVQALREELVQIAAVAVQIIEHIDEVQR
jgi:NTP pyrophosphatase (non-canonical NTP hydrolase)